MRRSNQLEFVQRAFQKHGHVYDYTKVVYRDAATKVEIVCPIHGTFWQTADAHIRGKGCLACSYIKRAASRKMTRDEFIQQAVAVHGDVYNYSASAPTGSEHKLRIGCPIHGIFEQKQHIHLLGSGCPKCGQARLNQRHTYTQKDFVAKSEAVHGKGIYDYAHVHYTRAVRRVEIICQEHGAFQQLATLHMLGAGCPKCYAKRVGEVRRHTLESFSAAAQRKHPGSRNYDFAGYQNRCSKIGVTCSKHGIFRPRAGHYLDGIGCPSCAVHDSVGELEVFTWVKSLCSDAVSRCRSVLPRRELDIVIPSAKLAIEYNGTYWHSCPPDDNHQALRDFEKWKQCQAAGYTLFVVWEQDWKARRPVIEHWLKHKLGCSPRLCGAREAEVAVPTFSEASNFYEQYHLQGSPLSSVQTLGLKLGSQWVVMASFSSTPERGIVYPAGTYYFARLALAGSVPGGASRIFKALVKQTEAKVVYAHSDNSYADGAVKALLGFEVVGHLKPRYRVWHPRYGIKHRTFWQKSKIATRMAELGITGAYDRTICTTFDGHRLCGCRLVWDCGKVRWRWELKISDTSQSPSQNSFGTDSS